MSTTRSPRLADIRRREDEADRRKVRIILAGWLALIAFLFVGYLTIQVWPS